jgi:hypothetical protein
VIAHVTRWALIRQVKRRNGLDGPTHEMTRGFGQDPGGTAGGDRGGEREAKRGLARHAQGCDPHAARGRV